MVRILLVGDPHATPSELPDCERLLARILEVRKLEDVRHVFFLGDMYHTHALVHLEVLQFWRKAFSEIYEAGAETTLLMGNHDRPGDAASTTHALLAHVDQPGVHVIDRPQRLTWIGPDLVAIPYQADAEVFVAMAKELGGETLFAHQTFQGAQYENGFYCPEGVEAAQLPQSLVISGHVHKPQRVGKVWYPGAPRWRSIDDANIERHMVVAEFAVAGNYGTVGRVDLHPTGCRKIVHARHEGGFDREVHMVWDADAGKMVLDPEIDFRLDFVGKSTDLSEFQDKYAGPGVKIRVFTTDTGASIKVRESEGIDKAFGGFLDGYRPRDGTPLEILRTLATQRLSWT